MKLGTSPRCKIGKWTQLGFCVESERLRRFGLMSQERRVERYKMLYLRKMLIGKVPDLRVRVCKESRSGPILELNRSQKGSDHVKVLRDRTLLVEGVCLYNVVPRRIREYNGSYLGFKNCVDRWIGEIPDCPRERGNEPLVREKDGKPSNSVKDWMRLREYREYDDSWVPAKEVRRNGDTGWLFVYG